MSNCYCHPGRAGGTPIILVYNFSRWKFARYVPAESVEHFSIAEAFAQLSETTRRTILTEICDKMLTRHAWDEIAALLLINT